MGHLQECDARNRLSAGRNKSQSSFSPVGHADRTNSSGIEPDGTKAKKPTFAEDFMLEHSLARVQIALDRDCRRFWSRVQRSATVSPVLRISFLKPHNLDGLEMKRNSKRSPWRTRDFSVTLEME